MKSREISRSKIGPFSLACTDPYIGIGWEYQSISESDGLKIIRSIFHQLIILLPLYAANCDRVLFVTPNSQLCRL